MSLTPETLRNVIMTSTMAYFDQMQKDIEVRIATVLALADTGVGKPVLATISKETSERVVSFLRGTVIASGELERIVDKLL